TQAYFFAATALLVLGALVWWWSRRPLKLPTPFADIPVQSVKAGDWSIRYHASGKGPHIVLLHGIGANLFCWRTLIPCLNGKYGLVALDLPGFGQSSKLPRARYGLDDQVERLHAFLTAIGIKQTYLVGNSMGGNIALWYALKYPDDVL